MTTDVVIIIIYVDYLWNVVMIVGTDGQECQLVGGEWLSRECIVMLVVGCVPLVFWLHSSPAIMFLQSVGVHCCSVLIITLECLVSV